ncbi:MAG: alpha/beta hydrolase [Thermoplasmata archaeon]|jgi:3-oxoadipate enol-lactonase|nr:alpha/beta hydrolase [Thermoplasmata archaeon]
MASKVAPPVELSFREQGAGAPILLLHGLAGDRLVWNSVFPGLSTGFRVIAPDLRGHGETPYPSGSTESMDELEADVLAFADRLGLSKIHWVGFSAGAFLALRIVLDHPERASSLTLVSGAAYCDAHQKAVMERWWSTYAQEGPDAFALRLLKDLYYPDWIEAHLEVADVLREAVVHWDFTAAQMWGKALTSFDEKNRIAALRIPTLMVQAMDDGVVDASHGRILRQTIPGAQIRILPQTGHMIPSERPNELVESIVGLVRKAESNSTETVP